MPSNVRVAVRVRPMLDHEVNSGHKQNILRIDTQSHEIS